MRFLTALQPVALLVMRVVLGVIMIAHGYPKMMGIGRVMNMVGGLGLPRWLAYALAGAEFFGGILIIAGVLTSLAALAICIDMSVAILKVHLPHGLTGQGGYEFPLAVLSIAFALIFFGPGPIALSSLLGGRGRR